MQRCLKVVIFVLSLLTAASVHALSLLMDMMSHTQPDIGRLSCPQGTVMNFTNVISCYRERLAAEPLEYSLLNKERLPGMEKQNWQLVSQSWSPEERVLPAKWRHDVSLFIPDNALPGRALIIANNGTRQGSEQSGPTDFTTATLTAIAKATGTIVISVSDIPNQYLVYQNDGKPRREDDSVARSWALFLDAPEQQLTMPLHIPMVAAVSQAMTLAQRELKPWDIRSFIVSGVSKRGWTAWLSAIADQRIEAIVPFVIDLLGTSESLRHMYRSYGGNWPVAFLPYYKERIDEKINTAAFSSLMKIYDPLQYLGSVYESRLHVLKYIINASGDDFYVPDNSKFYYDRLPEKKALRVVPNSDHYGIKKFTEQSLVTLIGRIQKSVSLPAITTRLHSQTLTVQFSEPPVRVMLWTAVNPLSRDFRYACGIRYSASRLSLTATGDAEVSLHTPAAGWQATFIEAAFSDGFIATTPVYITPDDRYPTSAPPSEGDSCKILPGRR